MKKSIKILLACAIAFTLSQGIRAASSEPAGKNLFNPQRMHVHDDGMYSFMPMTVEGGTTYTFSMPRPSHIGDMYVHVYDEHTTYVDQTTQDTGICVDDFDRFTCTFSTHHDTTELFFTFDSLSPPHFAQYMHHYGFMYFQLEVGETWTAFEPYEGIESSEPPTFQGSGVLITSYTTSLLLDDIIGHHITAYDDIDGDLSDEIVAVDDNYSGNETSVGEYDVLLEVSDTSGNTSQFLLTVHVVDDVPPTIDGPEEIIVDVESALALSQIIDEYFTFSDEIDGDILDYDVVSSDYDPTARELGQHHVTIAIEDAAGNQAEKAFTIAVVDNDAPDIKGPGAITLLMSDPYPSLEAIIDEHFTITDNHTSVDGIDVIIVTHDIPDDFAVAGDYSFTLRATDASGNTTERTIDVEIYDDVPPVIDGPEVIEVSYTSPLTLHDIIETLSVSDNHYNLSIQDVYVLTDSYTTDAEIPGVYVVEVGVTDGNNETRHTIYVSVIDDVPPIFTVSERIIVEEGTALNAKTLVSLLMREEAVARQNPTTADIKHIRPLDTPGHYAYTILLQNDDDVEWIETVLVERIATRGDDTRRLRSPHIVAATGITVTLGLIVLKRRK